MQAEDIRRFTEESEVDLLGVWVGQKHGTNYDFEGYLTHARELEQMDADEASGCDIRDMLTAVDDVLSELAPQFSETGFAVGFLRRLRSCLVHESPDNNAMLYAYGVSGELVEPHCGIFPGVALRRVLDSAHQLWHPYAQQWLDRVREKQIAITTRRRERIKTLREMQLVSVLDKGEEQTFPLRDLLHEYWKAVSDAPKFSGFVLHGGSSIARDDLTAALRFGVVKVNFGSTAYKLFLRSLQGTVIPFGCDPTSPAGVDALRGPWWRKPELQQARYLEELFHPFIEAAQDLFFHPLGWKA